MKTFRDHLKEKKQDPEFLKAYNEEKEFIELAVKLQNA